MSINRSLENAKVLVIGLGISGESATKFLLKRGALVTVTEKITSEIFLKENIQALTSQGVSIISENDVIDLETFDLVIVSPGISKEHPLYLKAKKNEIQVIGELELAASELLAHKKKCVAITGTNGKTTVTLLVEHILKCSGRHAKAFGNIGIPLTSAIDDPEFSSVEVIVLELSSFQLETLEYRFIDSAALLNITPDHLDRYLSMQDYANTKLKLIDNLKCDQKENPKFYIENRCFERYKNYFNNFSSIVPYGYSEDCEIRFNGTSIIYDFNKEIEVPKEYHFKKSHDIENLMAAFALCKDMGISPQEFLLGLSSFKKPPHRIEFVRTFANVHFINDSKGTNIDAVSRALETLEGKIVLIAGGVDKGFPYHSWSVFKDKIRMILCIGESKEKIQRDLQEFIPSELFSSLESAVVFGAKVAKPGETVLLSPGCSSYDMFKDYAHRGNEFRRIVHALKEEEVK